MQGSNTSKAFAPVDMSSSQREYACSVFMQGLKVLIVAMRRYIIAGKGHNVIAKQPPST